MVKLKANFKADLLAMARRYLAADWGPKVPQLSDDDLLIRFFDSLRRRPAVVPRRLWVADDFNCPPDQVAGWTALQKKVVEGGDLRPHLSRKHSALDALDGLLNEWGVHHLHLGIGPAPGASGHVQRSGPVLFARITGEDFYAINIYPHGAWENSNVLESLHRNWPDSIKNYRLKGVQGEPLSEMERRNLRKVNAQAATTTADGTVYMAIGGGVASSGTSADAVRLADMLSSDIARLPMAIEEQAEKFLPHLRARGYTDQAEIVAALVAITSDAFQVDLPDYGVRFNVQLEGGCFHRRPSP